MTKKKTKVEAIPGMVEELKLKQVNPGRVVTLKMPSYLFDRIKATAEEANVPMARIIHSLVTRGFEKYTGKMAKNSDKTAA